MTNKAPVIHPPFDSRITNLQFPMSASGNLKRGFMVWHSPISGFSGRAQVNFLYNPSVVEADFSLSDASVGSILLFPNSNDRVDLRVPLSQTVNWTIMYDRTYELWDSYNSDGTPKYSSGADSNNPKVVGVLADIYQIEQFTGMTVGYTSGFTASHVSLSKGSFAGRQGIVQLIPSYVFFGSQQSMSFYGYITDWNFQVTHWTQFMVPMRCIVNISWTMLPPPQNSSTPGPGGAVMWVAGNGKVLGAEPGSSSSTSAAVPSRSGVSGR